MPKDQPGLNKLESSGPEKKDVKKDRKSSVLLPVAITFLVAAVLCGGGVYLWQDWENNNNGSKKENPYNSYQQRIDGLEKQAKDKKDELTEKTKQLKDKESQEVKLPVVTYERAGLLDTTEKSKLKTKLLNPYFDYYNEKEMTYIAVVVTVPENAGEQYSVVAVHKDGGYQGFLFGKRGEDYDYWKPECMEECKYTDKFKEKYPEIVGE